MISKLLTRIAAVAITIAVCSFHASGKINISLTATQVLVNAAAVDSATTLAKIRQVTGADRGRFESWGDLGFWYIYDAAGVGLHWSADSTRLLSIYTEHHAVHSPLYRPSHDYSGTLTYLAATLTPFNNIWTLLRRGAGHVISIAPDLYSVYLTHGAYDAEITWYKDECMPPDAKDGVAITMLSKQKLESCVIYLGRQDYSAGRPPLRARNIKNQLYLGDSPAPDSLYSRGRFIPEARPCRDDIPTITQMGELESAFQVYDHDSLRVLKAVFKDSLLRNEFKIVTRAGSDYTMSYDENSINHDGYSLISYGYYAGATTVLEIGQELYPGSYNARDSYAEALLDDNRPQEAMKAYQSALTLNPKEEYDDLAVAYNSARHLRLIRGRAEKF